MILKPTSDHLSDFLCKSKYIDYDNDKIRQLAADLYHDCPNEISIVQTAYLFVRDQIAHSWDIQSKRITITASQVLQYREGICWAKSNLLAALLRLEGIPAGFCYQRLTIGNTPDTGYCIHAMNGVYFSTLKKWIRLDARGNKDGVDAQFSVVEESLAFPVRAQYEEIDYPLIYPKPLKCTMEVLERSSDCLKMYLHDMPTEISAEDLQ